MGREKMQLAQTLEQKVALLEKTIDEMSNQAKDLAIEHQTLTSERDALASQHKKIAHNVKALVAFKKNCSAFLDHKDDFDVDTIHDSLPPHVRAMVSEEASKPPSSKNSRGSSRGAVPPQQPNKRRVAAPVHAARVAVHKGQRGVRGASPSDPDAVAVDQVEADAEAAAQEDADMDDALADMLDGGVGDQDLDLDQGDDGRQSGEGNEAGEVAADPVDEEGA